MAVIAVAYWAVTSTYSWGESPINDDNVTRDSEPASTSFRNQKKSTDPHRARADNQRAKTESSSPEPAKDPPDTDEAQLAEHLGDETAAAIADGGPFNAFHVRTLAVNLKNLETRLSKMHESNADPEDIRAASELYFEMQNHYYAALENIRPYEANERSTNRLSEYERKVAEEGERLTEKEKQELKGKVLLGEK